MKTWKNLIQIAVSDECMEESLKTASERKTDRPEVQAVFEHKDKLKEILREKILKGFIKTSNSQSTYNKRRIQAKNPNNNSTILHAKSSGTMDSTYCRQHSQAAIYVRNV